MITSQAFLIKKTEIKEPKLIELDVLQSTPVEISVENITKRLQNLNVFKSPGPDAMHPRVLKEVRNEIAYPLTVIFEVSLETNTLPNDWKSGNITPIYKKVKKR